MINLHAILSVLDLFDIFDKYIVALAEGVVAGAKAAAVASIATAIPTVSLSNN